MSLSVSQLAKRYISPHGTVTALADVTFTAASGEFVALVGPSGCGKSTLLRIVAGLLAADSGTIAFPGWSSPPKRRFVFQDHSLFPWMTVLDNVAFGLEMDGMSKEQRRERAAAQLAVMGLVYLQMSASVYDNSEHGKNTDLCTYIDSKRRGSLACRTALT